MENVSADGAELPGCLGRLQNPGNPSPDNARALPVSCLPQHLSLVPPADSGHALEAGWFLLQLAAETGNTHIQKIAVEKFVELPYDSGWDEEHGGLFYFLDVDGHCPTQVSHPPVVTWCYIRKLN